MSYNNIRKLITVALIIILGILFAFTTDSFFSTRNFLQLLRESSGIGIISLGVACVIIGGGVDLSAGGITCFIGLIAARASFIPGIPGIAVVLIAILAGMLCGGVNALINTKLGLSPFVTTLSSGFVFLGLSLMVAFRTNGRMVAMALTNKSFLLLGRAVNGLYYVTIVWLVMLVLFQIFLTRTKPGLYLYAVGSNPKSATMSGINNDRMRALSYIMSGACCGLTAALMTAYQSGATQTLGTGMEFQAIASCVVGGIAMTGGKGDAISAFLGALLMMLITNGLYKWGLSSGGLYLMQGIIIVVVINFDVQFKRISEARLNAASSALGGLV